MELEEKVSMARSSTMKISNLVTRDRKYYQNFWIFILIVFKRSTLHGKCWKEHQRVPILYHYCRHFLVRWKTWYEKKMKFSLICFRIVVFGEVLEGMDVIDILNSTPTKPGDRPKDDITIVESGELKKDAHEEL